jgi:DNA-binding transcriptional LysR family regulator
MDRLSAMHLFVRVIETGTISSAGRALGMSSTAASKAIQDLERDLQVRLLERSTRHVSATEAGRHLYERLGPLLAELDTVTSSLGELHDRPTGTLRILARRSYGLLHVVPALPRFRDLYPEVRVDLLLTEAVEIAPTHGVDVVVRLGEPTEKSLQGRVLASDRRVMCASPGYLKDRSPPTGPDDLDRHDCLAYKQELEPTVWIFESAAGRREVLVSGSLRSNSGEVLRQAAVDGMGLVLLPEWMVAHELAAGHLVACAFAERVYPAGYGAEIWAVYARHAHVPAKVRVFVEFMEEWMARISDQLSRNSGN